MFSPTSTCTKLPLYLLAALLGVGCGASAPAPKKLLDSYKRVRSLAFAPKGDLLVGGRALGSGEKAASLMLWSVPQGTLQREIPAHQGDVLALGFHDNTCISVDARGGIELRSLSDWSLTGQVQPTGGFVGDASVSGPQVALLHSLRRHTYVPKSGHLQLWDAPTGRMLWSAPVPEARLVALAPDRTHLALGGARLEMWDTAGRRAVANAPFVATALAFSPDSTRLACATATGWCELQSADLKPIREVKERATLSVVYEPSGTLLTGDEKGFHRFQDGRETWSAVAENNASPSALAASGNGVCAGSGAAEVLLFGR